MLTRKLVTPAILAFTILVLSTGCSNSSGGYEYTDDPGPSTAAPATPVGPPITADELVGHWSGGDYGNTYIQRSGTSLRMVYQTNDGRVLGTLNGATFVGWWTETPTRRPADDAGDVQFTFSRSGGKLTAQGEWRNGTTGDFDTDWAMVKVDNVIPPAIRTIFAGQSGFLRRPSNATTG
jgi:hypothetical protein